jgi:hypothetical protein
MKMTMNRIRKILLATISEEEMASTDVRSIVLTFLLIALVLGAIYLVDPTFFGLLGGRYEGFDSTMGADANYKAMMTNDTPGPAQKKAVVTNPNSAGGDSTVGRAADASGGEGFADLEDVTGPAAFDSAQGPAGCYPRDQLTPSELLPKDPNSVWAQQNPMGTGSLKGKNFLSAGALIGVNTVGQSLRNANYQLRSEPPNPQVPVSVFYNSTIEPDTNRRDLEIN